MFRVYAVIMVLIVPVCFSCSDKKKSDRDDRDDRASSGGSSNKSSVYSRRHRGVGSADDSNLLTLINPKARRRGKTSEATQNLRMIFQGAVLYYEGSHQDPRFRQFPDSSEAPDGWAMSTCEAGNSKSFVPRGDTWSGDTWRALNFHIPEPFRYRYTFESEGLGADAQFTVRANGDLNCDGRLSTFERIGTVNDDFQVEGIGAIYSDKELE